MNVKTKYSWAQRKPAKFLLWFCIVVLLDFQFYSPVAGNAYVIKLSNTILIAFLLLLTSKQWFYSKRGMPLYNVIRWLLLSALITMIPAWIIKGQSIPLTFTVLARGELSIVLFFLLWRWQPSISSIEKVILIFGVVYVVLWCYAMYQFPSPTFGHMGEDEIWDEGRGIVRINFLGRGNVILAFFVSLNRFKNQKKGKWLFLAIVFFIFNVLQVTRQLILWPLLIAVIYILWRNKKLCIVTIVAISMWYITAPAIKVSDDTVIGSMINLSQKQYEDQEKGDENIRVTEYRYFFSEWNTNPITMLFGTSTPHANSSFGQWYTSNVVTTQNIFLSDVGYAAMYAKQGIFGLVLYIFLFYMAMRKKVAREITYTKMWFAFLILGNIAASWYCAADFVLCTALCSYVMIREAQNRNTSNTVKHEIFRNDTRI